MNLYTMNEQNNTTPPNRSAAPVPPAKRKRGRPRKDGSIVPKEGEGSLHQSPTNSVSDGIMRPIIQHQNIDTKPNDNSGGMVGRIVSGVIDGCFDAGYFLSVRIGNSNGPPLRGVLFDPGRVIPVSSDNDVAPNERLFHRSDVPFPAPNPQCQGNGISTSRLAMEMSQVFPSNPQSSTSFVFDKVIAPTNGAGVSSSPNNLRSSLVEQIVMQETPTFGYLSQPVPPPQNLRMVEQDEMMQVYEVSVQSEGLMEDAISSKDWNITESSAPKLNNQHVGLSPEQCLNAIEPKSMIQEATTASSSEVKRSDIKDSFHGLVLDQDHQQLDRDSMIMDTSLQPCQMVQNEPQLPQIFELHDTPIVDHTPPANQMFDAELHKTSTGEKVNPGCDDSELEQKLVHYALEGQNFGVLRDLVSGNHHNFLPISDQKFMMEKPDSPKCDGESVTHLESKTSESSEIRHAGNDSNEVNLQTPQKIPFDLELAAEESSRPETKVSSPTNNPGSLSGTDPR